MSDKKTLVERLEAFVAKHKAMFADLPPAENPSEYTLADGSKVTIDKLEIGGIVKLADGTLYPSGECYLADGSTITITDGGVIGAIETKTVEGAEPTLEDMKLKCSQFATGTPEERIARLETVCKAVMNYCYGWDMRAESDKAIKDAAIAAYSQFKELITESKETFTSKETEVASLKETVAKQGEIIKEMFEVLSQFSEAKPSDPPKQPLFEPKADKVAKFVESQLKK